MVQGREARAGVGALSRNGGAQGRLPGCRGERAAGCDLDGLGGLLGPREMDGSQRAGSPMVQGGDPAPARTVALLAELAVLASGHPDGHRRGNTLWPQTNSQLAKNNSPFTPWERGARRLPASTQPGSRHPGQEGSACNVTRIAVGTGAGRRKPVVPACFPLPSPALSAWESPLPGWGYWEQDPLGSAPLCPCSQHGTAVPAQLPLLRGLKPTRLLHSLHVPAATSWLQGTRTPPSHWIAPPPCD